MAKNLEILLDTNPSGGCGCNCGCGGSTVIEDMNELAEELKQYSFDTELNVNVLPISNYKQDELINKVNTLLDNTKATFRVNEGNIDDALKNILPLIILDGSILTAYGVPTLHDVVTEVQKSL